MSLPAWPAGLNHRSELRAWSATPTRGPREIEMERGNVRQERRPGARRGEYAWARTLNAAELVVWEDFIAAIEDGTARFTMLVAIRGSAYDTREVEIVAGSLAYAAAPGGRTVVSFRLRVYPSGAAGAVLASAEWPASLPYLPSRSAWGGAAVATWRETEIEDGAVRSAHRPWSRVARWSWSAEFSPAEMETFVAFLDQIGQGAARFWMPVALGGGRVEIRRVQIVAGSIKYVQAGDGYTTVSMEIRVYPAGLVPVLAAITTVAGATLSGTAPAGATVEIVVGTTTLSVVASGGGTWSAELAMVAGDYDARVRAVVGGSARPWSVPRRVTIGMQAATAALLARMSVQPTTGRASAINRLYVDLSLAGVLAKLDLLYILAAHDAQAARLNWVSWTGTVTNMVRNNSGQGAVPGVPGTLPTNWVGASGIGLTRSVVGVGTEGGIDYADIRWSGTPTATGAIPVTRFDSDTAVPVSAGQVWTPSLYYTLAAGSLDGVSTPLLRLREINATSTTVAGVTFPLTITARNLESSRQSYTHTVSNAAAAYLIFDLTINVTIGVPIDITLRIGLPQLVRLDVPGNPIRTTGSAASETQTLQRFALTPAGAPTFAADQGYAGATNAWLASRYNPAVDGVRYTRNSAHLGAWSLTNRGVANMIPGGVSMNTSLQCGLMARSASGLVWINVNDQGAALGEVTRSDGLTLGSRLDAASRSNYRDTTLLGTASAASIAVPSVPLDLLTWNANGGASRLYWCTDRIAVFTMGGGLTSTEVAAFHGALNTYLQSVGAVA